VFAFEPDRRNFKKLSLYAEGEERFKVEAINAAAWSKSATLEFDASGNRNSNISSGGKTIEVRAVSVDDTVGNCGADYIKYDVEGSEGEALLGSVGVIEKYTPRLLVSLYHRSEDIFELPILVKKMNPRYKLYLRRYRYIPAWDLNLICVR
jgi:FkbM family methyltransferase